MLRLPLEYVKSRNWRRVKARQIAQIGLLKIANTHMMLEKQDKNGGGKVVLAIPVVIAGVTGRTGEAVARAIHRADDMQLVGAVAVNHAGEHLGGRWSIPELDIVVVSEVDRLEPQRYAVLVDFTEAGSAFDRLKWAIEHGWDIVVGTTGFSSGQREQLAQLVTERQVGAALVANFSIGAWFLERVAKDAAQFFEAAEVVEGHHATKRDKPSGTAQQMRDLLAQAWKRDPDSIPVHSMRLPGLVAHQSVIFGSEGQVLTFRHDVHDRSAYSTGVLHAIRTIGAHRGRIVSDLGEILQNSSG